MKVNRKLKKTNPLAKINHRLSQKKETGLDLATGASSLTPTQMAHDQHRLANDTRDTHKLLRLPKAFAFGMRSIETTMREAAKRLESERPDERVYRLQTRSLSRLQQLLTWFTYRDRRRMRRETACQS